MDLKQARINAGKTQTQVAKEVGVSINAYQNWERGVMNPTEQNRIKLYESLGINKK